MSDMRTSDFDYQLPSELIAQTPLDPRDASRLMVVTKSDGSMRHRRFRDLPELLRRGDLLVFNDSRVVPARLYGRRDGSAGALELLLLDRLGPGRWRALGRPGRWLRTGARFDVVDRAGTPRMTGRVMEVEESGTRIIELSGDDAVVEEVGVVPLPPYIPQPLDDPERYQTVYARVDGSVAAPTAGLHFTEELLARVRAEGVETVFVTLRVGWGSFRPVQAEDPRDHDMRSEAWELGPDAASAVNLAKAEGRRVVSVGTTAARLLEHAAALNESGGQVVAAGSGDADLYILPGFRFRVIDGLLTNFHLPRSTLLMLVSAFAGRELVLKAYAEAIEQRYRFYSFGDAMLFL